MNIIEADALVGQIRRAAVFQEQPDERLKAMAEALIPLPLEECRRNVERWALAVRLDDKGIRLPKFVTSLDDVLDACGVPGDARHLIDTALRDGGMVLPSLRAACHWEHVPPDGEIPRGVGEFYANADRPLPLPGRGVAIALPAASTEQLADRPDEYVGEHLSTIGRGLQASKNGALRRLFEERQHPPAPFVPDREAMPPVLRQAVDAAEAERDRLERRRLRVTEQERAYRELCGEMAKRLHDNAPDCETAKTVAVELLRTLAADEGYGVGACVEVLRDALNPALVIAKCEVERGPKPDEFEDTGEGPVVGLRLLLKVKNG